MKLNRIVSAPVLLAVLLGAACKVSKPFEQPKVNADSLFRGVTTVDTNTIAEIPWNRLFKDADLHTLLSEGVANNNDLKVAIARIKQAEANLRQSRAAFYPNISGGPQVTQQKLSVSQGGGVIGPERIYQLSANASWEADLWGKLKSSNKAAMAALLQSEAYRKAVQTQLIADIATSYYNLLAFDKQLAITIETVKNRKADVETNKALKESNRITEAAVAESEANRYAAEVTIPDLQNSIRQTENAISVLIARKPGGIQRGLLDLQQIDTLLQTGVPAQLLSNRPDVMQAEFAVRFYFEQINVARAYFYPSLTITAQGGWQSASTSTIFNGSALFGNIVGGLTQPIFNNGINKQRLEISKAQYEENVATFQQTVLDAGREVSDALYSYESVQMKANTRRLQLQSWKKAVEYNRELLKDGYATYTAVLTSEQGYLTAQLDGVDDRLQQLTAIVSLYRSLGGGWK
jgi:multidrug efflux system outer membrane protein